MASNRIKALANTSEFGKKIVNYEKDDDYG